MFTEKYRASVQAQLVRHARNDARVTAAALVGSSAEGGDRWSDLDLTLSVAEDAAVDAVLGDWTQMVIADLDGDVLFDLPYRSTIYRVFLLPGLLQVDLSFTPAPDFGPRGPRFRLLFGMAREGAEVGPAPLEEGFGLAVHHAVRALLCVERGRLWQSEYWLHSLRDETLSLSCRRRGIPSVHGRGYDALPTDLLSAFEQTLCSHPNASELRRALAKTTRLLLEEADGLKALTPRLRRQLEGLTT
ncbi:MAG TPA: nucleotidyltransferase domain-containing protein [Chloroflexota bacterium]|nr:nucleotidyltransferase domain-containing protein [Chloroflexota bacterium]